MKVSKTHLILAFIIVGLTACGEPSTNFVPEIPVLPVFPAEMDVDLFWVPEDNPTTAEKTALGWQLFYDQRLSSDETISCASCHFPNAGFADPSPGSVGVNGAVGDRNAPSVINAMFNEVLFWDGRSPSLEEQAVGPIMNPIEMGNTPAALEERLAMIPGYRQQFESVFGSTTITAELVGKALATFERSVVSLNSPWDRFVASGDSSVISEAALRGNELFNDRAACSGCHVVTRVDDVPDDLFQNIGVGMDNEDPDLGRFIHSGAEEDRGAFRTPTLRNVAQTAPYMHDGSLETLEDVVRYYDRGGTENEWLDDKIEPLDLSDQEVDDLLAFLDALTGDVPGFTRRAPLLPPDMQ